ncbi:MAG: cysteine hydrolase [Alphaproteobacteria bacterium]|nr:cysteine hydrolase [Alphaproteobacteria bacterium]
MTQNILMRIDFQNDFVHPHGALSLNAPELIEKHQKFADSLFAGQFDKIIETYDTHFAETYANTSESDSFPPHCLQGTWGWQQAAPFKPELEVEKMYKSTVNIWNELKQYRTLQQDWGDTNVYLCGVFSEVCVKHALNGLLKHGANVIVIEDLCQGANQQISDILQKDVYQPFIEAGALRRITAAQFFRKELHNKKVQHNLVHKTLGE